MQVKILMVTSRKLIKYFRFISKLAIIKLKKFSLMLPKKTLFILSFFYLIIQPVISQKVFREGYIVKKDGQVLYGLAGFKTGRQTPSVCVFKRFEIAVPVTYKPGEITEFGYVNGNRYKSVSYEGQITFFEVLVSGDITLYLRDSQYYLEKGTSGLTDISGGKILFGQGADKKEFDDTVSLLKFLTEGKINIAERINLREDLVPLISAYNEKTGESNIVYKQDYSNKMLTGKSIRQGTKIWSIGIYAGVNIYNLLLNPERDYYIPDPEPEITPVTGLSYERIISRKDTKTSLVAELLFIRQTFYSYSESSFQVQKYKDDAFFDFTGIKIPVMIQYSFTSGKIVPYLNGGISCLGILQNNYNHIRETESYGNEIDTNEDNDMQFQTVELTGLLGAGIKLKITNSLRIDLKGRIELGNGIFKPITGLKEFSQYSLQPTLLLGIFF